MPVSKGISADQKKMLGISVATLLLGGAAWAVAKNIPQTDPPTLNEPNPLPTPPLTPTSTLPADIDVAGKVTDTMPFGVAFEAARNEVGIGGVFNWHGRWYNTFRKDEWADLSLDQRAEYAQMITGEELPVKPYKPVSHQAEAAIEQPDSVKPTIIEGYLNGQRVMGLDSDNDGVIDALVMDGEDGHTYRVIDATGDQGLDTVYKYDALDGDWVKIEKIKPFVLSNDDFSQHLENSMSREVVESISEPDETPIVPAADVTQMEATATEMDNEIESYEASSSPENDTYVNNGDVYDMES